MSRERKANFEEAVRIIMDLSDEEVDGVLEAMCNAAGINREDVAAIFSSPPCETYSHADATNISRIFHHRQHDDPEEPPRIAKEGDIAQAIAKIEKARNHDRMIQRLTQQPMKFRKEHGCEIVMENLVGSLAKRPFMGAVMAVGSDTHHGHVLCIWVSLHEANTPVDKLG